MDIQTCYHFDNDECQIENNADDECRIDRFQFDDLSMGMSCMIMTMMVVIVVIPGMVVRMRCGHNDKDNSNPSLPFQVVKTV